jgi:hypothetical protein
MGIFRKFFIIRHSRRLEVFVDGLIGLWEENNNDYSRKILLC